MPIYRYRCANCGAQEEHLQKVSDAPKERCSKCGGALAKQMTAAAFHLKGGGWYKDLYSSSGKSDASGGSSGTSSSSTSSSDSGSSSGGGSSGGSDSSGSSSSSSSTSSTSSGSTSSGSTSSTSSSSSAA